MNPILRWFHQLGSPPYFDRFAARWAPWGYGLGLLVMAVGMYWGLFHTPADYQQSETIAPRRPSRGEAVEVGRRTKLVEPAQDRIHRFSCCSAAGGRRHCRGVRGSAA
jgi:hypothetical protein